ncbi:MULTISPECIES: histidine phosphatase family protein [unclassified Aureimonas]|uniref:histidine phosphatase family protein n=1 Tax=unclassified Aureimonas TaxID=2615206 RepID=UPI0006F734F0|nr:MULTISPECIES: histidine phosphatase family protein [unclassified Aureimonas]KQT62562.1 phosphoglycerate mutase [Aureimonas sp. Leaf427]KQT73210.1 phosphoglycerate mutase [Aureimonas sp. Leaf460]
MRREWPERIWIVRHGESMGNVARDAAMSAGHNVIDISDRDIDVPLSPLGHEQAEALGRWFTNLAPSERPEVILSSPYLRARQTSAAVRGAGGLDDAHFVVDERLREKEFGILDRLTTAGVRQNFPKQAEFRNLLGKFYHRPPGGESWCDVILRVRSMLDTIALHYEGRRVLIVCHQVVVLCLRYVLEELDEEGILAIDREADVANCSVTEYVFSAQAGQAARPCLERYNFVAPLHAEGTPVTAEPDVNVAAR